MTVTVQKLQGGLGSGSLPATNFSDTFVRADAPPFLGPQWFTMENQNNLVDGGSVDLCTNITANKAIFGSGTVTSYGNMSVQFTPAAVYVPAIVTKVQTQGRKMFSQFQITSHTANGLNFGPMVLGVVNAFGYTLDLSGAGLKAQLLRGLGINVPVQTLLATNLFTWADGDVVRIEGAFTAGACTLEFFQNGVSKGTFVDNSVGRIAAPQIYGISMANVGANNSIAVNNFSGGNRVMLIDEAISAVSVAIAFAEGFYVSGSRSARNHNPGDLTVDITGKGIGHDGIFVVYANDSDGWDALKAQVGKIFNNTSSIYNSDMTINDIAQRYTTTDQAAWAMNVASNLGVSPDTKISELLTMTEDVVTGGIGLGALILAVVALYYLRKKK